jgi:ribosomal-protein-alanine N-acetyltransferase
MIKQVTNLHLSRIEQYEKLFVNNERYNKKQLKEMLKSKTYFLIGYFNKNELVGYLIANVNDISVDLFKIFISEKFRKKGIAKKLINYLINYHRNKPIYVEVLHTNDIAIKMYLHLGFKVINERKNYYGENKNAIIMVI